MKHILVMLTVCMSSSFLCAQAINFSINSIPWGADSNHIKHLVNKVDEFVETDIFPRGCAFQVYARIQDTLSVRDIVDDMIFNKDNFYQNGPFLLSDSMILENYHFYDNSLFMYSKFYYFGTNDTGGANLNKFVNFYSKQFGKKKRNNDTIFWEPTLKTNYIHITLRTTYYNERHEITTQEYNGTKYCYGLVTFRLFNEKDSTQLSTKLKDISSILRTAKSCRTKNDYKNELLNYQKAVSMWSILLMQYDTVPDIRADTYDSLKEFTSELIDKQLNRSSNQRKKYNELSKSIDSIKQIIDSDSMYYFIIGSIRSNLDNNLNIFGKSLPISRDAIKKFGVSINSNASELNKIAYKIHELLSRNDIMTFPGSILHDGNILVSNPKIGGFMSTLYSGIHGYTGQTTGQNAFGAAVPIHIFGSTDQHVRERNIIYKLHNERLSLHASIYFWGNYYPAVITKKAITQDNSKINSMNVDSIGIDSNTFNQTTNNTIENTPTTQNHINIDGPKEIDFKDIETGSIVIIDSYDGDVYRGKILHKDGIKIIIDIGEIRKVLQYHKIRKIYNP